MLKWVENFPEEWVEYPFLAKPTNANSIANSQCERILRTIYSREHKNNSVYHVWKKHGN